MLSKKTSGTIVTRFLILAANFVLVVASTRLWGSEGRGEIALVLANIAIIAIFGNIFCGSTISFHTPLLSRDILLTAGFAGALFISLAGSLFFSFFFGFRYFPVLLPLAFALALFTLVTSYWLGKNNLMTYNIITLLNPLFILISLFIIYYLFDKTALKTYYQAWFIGTGSVSLLALAVMMKRNPYKFSFPKSPDLKRILNYGVKNEFNYLIQFLSYRLSYYLIAQMLGFKHLGIFSVVISVSESIWIISRSMSAVHFSNVINSNDIGKNQHDTVVFTRQSFIISTFLLAISVLIPGKVYQLVFGAEFGEVRRYILYLVPGIISIAVSNLYDQYFSGLGNLKILRNKSLLSLTITIFVMPVMVKKYNLEGACISQNIAYLLPSAYLWIYFRREVKKYNFKN